MPAETSSHKLPYPLEGDSADVPRDVKALAVKTDEQLDKIAPKQIVGGSKGQLAIVDNTGATAFKAMKGDGTIDGEGNFQLASPNNGVWRHVASAETPFGLDRAAGVWALAHGGPIANGANFQGIALTVLRLDIADYAVSGKTTQLRLFAQLLCNGVFPNTDFKLGLYRLNPSGGTADAITLNIGERVVGPITFATPSSGAMWFGFSEEVTLTAGYYIFAVETTAALANNAAAHLSAQLKMRHV